MKTDIIFLLLLTSCVAVEDISTAYKNCVIMKDPNFCKEYKIMKFMRRMEMESATDKVVQKIKERKSENFTEKIDRLLTLLMDILYPPKTNESRNNNELLESPPRSSELKTSLAKGKSFKISPWLKFASFLYFRQFIIILETTKNEI